MNKKLLTLTFGIILTILLVSFVSPVSLSNSPDNTPRFTTQDGGWVFQERDNYVDVDITEDEDYYYFEFENTGLEEEPEYEFKANKDTKWEKRSFFIWFDQSLIENEDRSWNINKKDTPL